MDKHTDVHEVLSEDWLKSLANRILALGPLLSSKSAKHCRKAIKYEQFGSMVIPVAVGMLVSNTKPGRKAAKPSISLMKCKETMAKRPDKLPINEPFSKTFKGHACWTPCDGLHINRPGLLKRVVNRVRGYNRVQDDRVKNGPPISDKSLDMDALMAPVWKMIDPSKLTVEPPMDQDTANEHWESFLWSC